MDIIKAALLRHIVEREKIGLENRASLVHAAMIGGFMAAIYSPQGPSALAQTTLDTKLRKIGSKAADEERRVARRSTQEIFNIMEGEEIPNMESDLLTFQGDVVRQVTRDAKSVSNLFRTIQTKIDSLGPQGRLMARVKALQHVNQPSTFTYKDKAGKIWNASVYLKTHGSQYYYGLTNGLSVSILRSKGEISGTLDRPGHDSDGAIVNLSELDTSRYFHPGSQGILI